jgi:tetratricopeptide (TPR) repeat protein
MFSIQPPEDTGLRFHDALLFPGMLCCEVEQLLPMPASADFWFHDQNLESSKPVTPEQAALLAATREGNAPFVSTGILVIPLLTDSADQPRLDLIIRDVDSAMLEKMAPSWLLAFQQKVLERFAFIRQVYTDPFTGLYNQRALEQVMAGNPGQRSLFLIATASTTHTVAGSFQKNMQSAAVLAMVTREPLFYFGQGVYGIVSSQCDRPAALAFSHHLLSRLKQEGLRRVHVGFSCLDSSGEQSASEILDTCRLVLHEAERRGPYSLCDAAFLHRRDQHPFALPAGSVVNSLQRKWRKLDSFALLLVEFSPENKGEIDSSCLPAASFTLSVAEEQIFILVPDYPVDKVQVLAESIADAAGTTAPVRPSIGFCHWPATALSKTDCIRSCRKAILHGSFYGAGAVVGFDSLSLNVSGDLYFDEGDYKQAIREYRLGLQMKPDDINLLNSLGVALAEVNRHREAIDCFVRVLEHAPENYMALVNRGMSCRQLGQAREAVHCFEQAMRCTEHRQQASIEFYLQLGRLYCLKEQFAKAVDLLNDWQELRGVPGEFPFFRLMGEACMGVGSNRKAILALQHSLRLQPHNTDSQSMLGLLYVLEGQGAEVGLSLCNRAVATETGESEHCYRRGLALFHLGRFSEALADVRAVLRIRRNNDRAVLLRAQIYEQLGSLGLARQSYQRVLKLNRSAGRCRKAKAGLRKIAGV